jgi:hypothetical protein
MTARLDKLTDRPVSEEQRTCVEVPCAAIKVIERPSPLKPRILLLKDIEEASAEEIVQGSLLGRFVKTICSDTTSDKHDESLE